MKIKINKTLLFAFSLSCAVVSCKKFAQVEPLSQMSINDVFANVPNATQALMGVYDELSGDNGYGIRLSMYFPYDADDMMTSGNNDNGRRGIGRYSLNTGNTELNAPFRQLYRGIEKANMCIEQIPQMNAYLNGSAADKKEAQRLYGEALTLRAHMFFELIRNWGDVPAPFTPSYTKTDLFLPKVNRDETYDHIINDLKTAEDMVPWKSEAGTRNERITKGAVKAIRAKIALFRGGYSLRSTGAGSGTMQRRDDYLKYYQIARDECFEIMQRREEHTLNPSFENIFRTMAAHQFDPKGEILFEVGHTGGSAASDSKLGYYNGPGINSGSRYGQGGTGIRALPTYFYAFDSIDTRRDITITAYTIDAVNIKSTVKLNAVTDGKFRRDWSLPLIPGTINYVGYNWPIIRFSDVLLMFAESENEIKGAATPAAVSALEEVRKRAFAGNESRIGTTPTDKAAFFNAVVRERYLEFGDEGIRKYDLIRWNLLKTKLTEARQNLTDLMNGAGAYAGLPKVIYWKNNGEEIQWLTSFYKTEPATAPSGSKSLDWVRSIVAANVSDPVNGSAFAQYFTANKGELMPFDQSTLGAYNGALINDYGY